MKRTIESIAVGLEQGRPLDVVFAEHRNQFSPLYAKVVEAGLKSSNLPAVLVNLGRGMETTRRLRSELIRAVAYPLMVLLAVGVLVVFLGRSVFPQIVSLYTGFNGGRIWHVNWSNFSSSFTEQPPLPISTSVLNAIGQPAGVAIIAIALLMLLIPLLWTALPNAGITLAVDGLLRRLPLIGPVLRKTMIARWLDAMAVSVAAGMDLPAAIELASGSAGSPALAADGRRMIDTLNAGGELGQVKSFRALPASIPPTLGVAAKAGNLAEVLASLADNYQQQAAVRISLIPAILTPILMSIVAALVAVLILSLLAPLSNLMQWIGNF